MFGKYERWPTPFNGYERPGVLNNGGYIHLELSQRPIHSRSTSFSCRPTIDAVDRSSVNKY